MINVPILNVHGTTIYQVIDSEGVLLGYSVEGFEKELGGLQGSIDLACGRFLVSNGLIGQLTSSVVLFPGRPAREKLSGLD